MTLAVVIVNECAGLGPGDLMYWVLSCWALPFWRIALDATVILSIVGSAVGVRRAVVR